MSDNSISRVYQFLTDFNKENGDWREVADVTKDGVIIKTEFRNFMLNNFDWNGEESSKDDLINKFWKTVDVNTSGKISGTKTKNKNALSSDELDKMDVKIQIFEKMNEYVKANVNPAESGVTNKSAWLKSVKESLGSYIEQYVKNGGTLEGVEEFLAQKLPIAKSMASANYYVQEYLKSDEVKALVPDTYKGQGTIQKIIDAFVTSLKEDDTFLNLGSDSERLSYIKSKAQEIVKDYLSTADLCAGNPDDLGEYGYYTDGDLNDIQEAVLVDTMGKSIQSYLEEKHPDICTKGNKEAIQSAVDNFINTKLQGASYDDFKTLKSFDASEIEDDDDFLALISQLEDEFEELNDARQSLKDYCAELVARGNDKVNDAIKKVFGSMDYAAKIDKCKDVAAVQTLEEKIKARVEDIDGEINTPDRITVSLIQGQSKSIDLPSVLTSASGQSITTDKIEYRVASGSHLTLNGSGVTVQAGAKAGTFIETVDIYVNGKKRTTQEIEVVVAKGINLATVDAKVGENTLKEILSSRKATIQLSGFATWDTARDNAKSSIRTYLNSLSSALIGAGLDEESVNKAATTTLNYYISAIDAMNDALSDSGEGSFKTEFTYLDANGESHAEQSTYSQKTRHRERDAGRTDEGARALGNVTHTTGIRMNESYAGTNTYEYYLNLAVLLDKFQEFYKW